MSSDSIQAINSTISSTAHNSYLIGNTLGGVVSGFARFVDFGDILPVVSATVAEVICSVKWLGDPRRLLGDRVAAA